MSVAVVVPFRGGCPHREKAWAFVRRLYAEHHPDWRVIEARAPDGEWCKGAALGPAIDACEAELVIQADADVWTDGLPAAVEAVESGMPWAQPHGLVHRLSEEGTVAVLSGEDWWDQPLAQRPYRGVQGGGIVVAMKDVLRAVPVDTRFIGWGQEDMAQAAALETMVGCPWRGSADLIHLWHPPQQRMTRRRGSQEAWVLWKRYSRASQDPAAMQALLAEFSPHSMT